MGKVQVVLYEVFEACDYIKVKFAKLNFFFTSRDLLLRELLRLLLKQIVKAEVKID